ncbi:Glyoxylate reductase/hydroxypyruvate reductase [Frankliniella fusca]|uniref:Glyoxylate reductase/hydroxypyruvate reductase n=1 Tax=Frankliniella fusca TaxID=407009 RepID=A0AAE1LL69_9NEOP|nr:Glyoxylate reductase/hydroxypyruvate reductase [Frankliniella fusca]
MGKPKVLVSSSAVPEAGLARLRQECELVLVPGNRPTHETIVKHIPATGVDAIYWCSKYKLDAEVINAAGPGLRAVATMSAGYDHIDAGLLKQRGIPLGNTANVLNDAVADTAVALVLTVLRRLQEGRRMLERGLWVTGCPQFMLGLDVTGSTVGIVGLGGIGQAFAKRIKAFNIGKLQYCGHKPKPEASALGAEFVTFEELVRTSDIIVLACPLTPETKDLFNEDVFEKMKSTSILINVGRGGCIEQEALVNALKNKKIWGAGLDVMTPEPIPPDHPLVTLENCVLFPHVGSATEGTRAAMAVLAAENILCHLRGEPMPSPV